MNERTVVIETPFGEREDSNLIIVSRDGKGRAYRNVSLESWGRLRSLIRELRPTPFVQLYYHGLGVLYRFPKDEPPPDDRMTITIDDYGEVEVTVIAKIVGWVTRVKDSRGVGWNLAPSREAAGTAARRYWEEFAAIVDEETLVAWALGHPARPGQSRARSLEEWLDLIAERPEEEWGRYGGTEHAVLKVSPALLDELCWPDHEINKPVAYRLD